MEALNETTLPKIRLTYLFKEKTKYVTKETMMDYCHGKNSLDDNVETFMTSLSEDNGFVFNSAENEESFYRKLRALHSLSHSTADQESNQLKMLTEQEKKKLKNCDPDFIETFASSRPDITFNEMAQSESNSTFALFACSNRSFTIERALTGLNVSSRCMQ